MLAVQQKNKIRIVMDLSNPAGASFNEAVNERHLQKITMSTAKQVAAPLSLAGKGHACGR
jgi:hypothetical protein